MKHYAGTSGDSTVEEEAIGRCQCILWQQEWPADSELEAYLVRDERIVKAFFLPVSSVCGVRAVASLDGMPSYTMTLRQGSSVVYEGVCNGAAHSNVEEKQKHETQVLGQQGAHQDGNKPSHSHLSLSNSSSPLLS